MDAETKRLVRLNVSMRLAALPVDIRGRFRTRVTKSVIGEAKRRAKFDNKAAFKVVHTTGTVGVDDDINWDTSAA